MAKRFRHLFEVRTLVLLALLIGSVSSLRAEAKASKGTVFFFRVSRWVDDFQLRGLDTNYIALPEHSWRVALSTGGVGIHSRYTTWVDPATAVTLRSRTIPNIDVGFNIAYRGYGGGYSWDVLNPYTTKWNISLGGNSFGLEFVRNVSSNLTGKFYMDDEWMTTTPVLNLGEVCLSTSSLKAWYALNTVHYSHNAAIDQSYIQKRTAGSLLLSVAYMSCQMAITDSAKYIKDESAVTLIDDVTGMITRQVAVGIGYGINYTPNRGKVLIHAAANMQVVCYSVNHVSYALPSSSPMHGEPQYVLHPAVPVHVTGNMRAAVSWEINRWVHLAAWAQASHLRFASKSGDMSTLSIANWNWQAYINVGVRFGAGRKRVREVLDEPDQPLLAPDLPAKKRKLPRWLTDYFFSSPY